MDVTLRSLFSLQAFEARSGRARLEFVVRSPRLLRRQARVVRRDAFDDGVAVRHAHVVHQRVAALAVAIGAQRQDQIILVLRIDDRDGQRRIVDVAGVAAIALVGDVLEQMLSVFGGLRFLRRVEGDDVIDLLIAQVDDDALT